MGQQFATGAVPVFVGTGSSLTPVFLGYSERGPQMSVRPSYSNLFVDVGGPDVPFDVMYTGEEGLVTVDLTYWTEAVYAAIAAKAVVRGAGAAALRGVDVPGQVGTFMVGEGCAYQLWLNFPYSTKAAMATMPAGYRWAAAMLVNDDLPDLGNKPRKLHLIWRCLRVPNFAVTNAFGTGSLTLFDHNMSALAGVVAA